MGCAAAAFTADQSAPPAPAAPVAAGQMIFIDPGTGKIVQPTVEEWSQLPRPIAAKAKKIVEQVRPDGSLVVPADQVMFEMRASVGADGRVQLHCDDSEAP